jgi:hypothetical protein
MCERTEAMPKNVAKIDSARRSKSFAADRTCRAPGCTTRLSRYNPDPLCSVHAQERVAARPTRR